MTDAFTARNWNITEAPSRIGQAGMPLAPIVPIEMHEAIQQIAVLVRPVPVPR